MRDEAEDTGPGEKQGTDSDHQPGDAGTEDSGEPSGRSGRKNEKSTSLWKELPVLIGAALVLAFAIRTFAVQPFYIPSGSMENTLQVGDRVLVNKIVFHTRDIARGDLVVFNGMDS